MDQNSEATEYQWYTIVNDPVTSLVLENQNLQENIYEIGEEDDAENQIVYLTIKQFDDETEEHHQVTFRKEDEDEPDQHVTHMKLITLDNGEMYLTTDNSSDKSLVTVQPHLLTDTITEEEEQVIKPVKEETEENITTSSFHEVKLGDGSRAIVDADVWNSLIKDTFTEEPDTSKKKRFACEHPGCGKSFTTTHHLQVHVRCHTGKRPFVCNVQGCNRAFTTGYSLKSHSRIHTGEKPYGCNMCLKRFKTSGDLQKHVRTHTGEKPFKCPVEGCDKSFTTSNIRKVHIRSHTGERPYVCHIENCGKAFASATNYKNHMRIHTGEKPYVCSVENCGKRFTEYSSLYKHSAVHQVFRTYRCNYCTMSFRLEHTLKVHKRLIHSIVSQNGREYITPQDNEKAFLFEFTDPGYLGPDPLLLPSDKDSS